MNIGATLLEGIIRQIEDAILGGILLHEQDLARACLSPTGDRTADTPPWPGQFPCVNQMLLPLLERRIHRYIIVAPVLKDRSRKRCLQEVIA
jgi:hypothetical protein